MTRRLLLAAGLALALASPGSAQTEPDHTFQIWNGQVYVDGHLVPDAVPDSLDLSGFSSVRIEITGDVAPLLEVDGAPYVFENDRLIRLEDSARAKRRGIYVLPQMDPPLTAAPPAEQITPVAEGAYLREVAERNEALYNRMRREHQMEQDAYDLAVQVRSLPDGPQRAELRDQLHGLLSDLLTLKQEILSEEIRFLQDRLQVLSSRLDERDARHGEIVDRRLRELIGEE